MLWTDASSREFIANHYAWFLDTFDGYTYPIQRADAIRYFVLHYYGGIYYDLDIGCRRPLDPLLVYPVILPKTIPVGVSNDLLVAEKGHPFFEQAIHGLIAFDHSWLLNYPTVMFSTGPMFLSAQYGLYISSHPSANHTEIRILPKSLYGKNAKPGEAPHSFFDHFYGSSWHADDAPFIGFLGKWGRALMWIGLVVLVAGVIRLVLTNGKQRKYNLRRAGGYDVLLPRWTRQQGRWYLDLGWFRLPGSSNTTPHEHIQTEGLTYLPVDSEPSPDGAFPSETLMESNEETQPHPLVDAVGRTRNRFMTSAESAERSPVPETPTRTRRFGGPRGVLFFLPAFWSNNQDIELTPTQGPSSSTSRSSFSNFISRASQLPPEKQRYAQDLERAGLLGDPFEARHVVTESTPAASGSSLYDINHTNDESGVPKATPAARDS
jgi:inositol phosphorylceramide mannosyltransferase catalytic subunit